LWSVGGIIMAVEIEVLEKYLPQTHFVNHKSHINFSGIEPETLQ
jgi:hypothetical protein